MRRWIFIGLVSVLVVAGYFYWAHAWRTVPVKVVQARRGPLTGTFSADGLVKGRTVFIASKFSARIESIVVKPGQAVKAGDVLIRLEDGGLLEGLHEAEAARTAAAAALEQARAQWEQVKAGPRPQEIEQARQHMALAKANLDAAEKALARARELFDRGAVSQAELDEAVARHDSAESEHRAAEAALDLLEASARPEERAEAKAQVDSAAGNLAQADAAVRSAATLLAETTLKAPFDGTVSLIPIEVGQFAAPGVPLLTLVDARNLYVEAEVSDEDVSKVRPGLPVFVTIAAYPGRRFRAVVAEIAPHGELKPETALRTYIVRANVQLLEGAELLRPGLEVDVEGEGTIVESALLVPSDALMFEKTRNVVYVVENGRAHIREVHIGGYTYEATEILDGLKEGEPVVIAGKEALTEGQRVQATSG